MSVLGERVVESRVVAAGQREEAKPHGSSVRGIANETFGLHLAEILGLSPVNSGCKVEE